MLFYGNTPRDIMRIMRNRKWKLIGIMVMAILIVLALTGCTVGSKKVNPPLMALEKFWDTLGTGVDKTKSKDE